MRSPRVDSLLRLPRHALASLALALSLAVLGAAIWPGGPHAAVTLARAENAAPEDAEAETGESGSVRGGESSAERPDRLISLNPSLTAIVLRLGGGAKLVGVDDYSARVLEAVSDLPRVGGLFDPSLESVMALRPDRVLLVAGVDQRSHAARLARLGLEVEVYENERLSEVLENIARIGRLLGREEAAAGRIRAIRSMYAAVSRATEGLGQPRTLAVVDRSPLHLVGAATFLDEMLEAVGALNLARSLGAGYPRGSIEWLIAAEPELLIDMTPNGPETGSGSEFWSRWPSLPAVEAGLVLTLDARRISLPGPDLDRALRELAVAVHGPSIGPRIDAALARGDGSSGTAGSSGSAQRARDAPGSAPPPSPARARMSLAPEAPPMPSSTSPTPPGGPRP
ncbi:MAG: ABC transporter substrate-binding protein [bacterium]